MDRNGKVADSDGSGADSGWELTDSSWDFPMGAAGGGRMSFCQAFPTTRDPHKDVRTVKSTRKGNATMDAARAPQSDTRGRVCSPEPSVHPIRRPTADSGAYGAHRRTSRLGIRQYPLVLAGDLFLDGPLHGWRQDAPGVGLDLVVLAGIKMIATPIKHCSRLI